MHRCLIVGVLFLSAPSAAEPPPTPTAPPPPAAAAPQQIQHKVPFTPGEECVYEIEAMGMSAGKARLSVGASATRDGLPSWPIVVLGRTDSLFDHVFSIRDKFVTWWHPETGRVIGTDLYAEEGGKRHRSRSRLDHAAGKAEVLREKDGQRNVSSYDIPVGSFDIAGAVMALRARPLRVGDVEEIHVFTGKKSFLMRCHVETIETLETEAGTFDAVAVRIELGFEGNFASKQDVRGWFSNDARHIPLKLKAELMLGSLVVQLVKYQRGISL